MKFVVRELVSEELSGTYTAPRNVNLVAVRPHLYRHNFQTGTLKVEVLDNEDNLLAESESIEINDIVGPNEYDFFHGYVRFYVSVGLKKDETYKFKLVGEDGYSFDPAAYVGWCSFLDLNKYQPTYTPSCDLNYPLDIELWERKTK